MAHKIMKRGRRISRLLALRRMSDEELAKPRAERRRIMHAIMKELARRDNLVVNPFRSRTKGH